MLHITQRTLDEGKLKLEWAEALRNVIPKGRRIVQVTNCRPLVLQNTAHKWMATLVALQTQDLVSALTPSEQKGFIKEWSIFNHLWHCFGVCRLSQRAFFALLMFEKILTPSHTHTHMPGPFCSCFAFQMT